MRRVSKIDRAADCRNREITATITLDREARWRRRAVLRTDDGSDVLLDLAEAAYLADGDCLVTNEGTSIRVIAAAEALLEIHAATATGLTRLAWHIGNRHVPCEVTGHALYIQPDHVLEEMVERLGGHVHRVMRPFEPEGGAYGAKGALNSGHAHGGTGHHHPHDHDHGHSS